ncbi:zinc finger protein ZAT4-like [Mangifera indica]|uniref:zinc finger protein ZAT4-like n=1 Tax=Mangifera indica TaxID=29780 RepID=UPI001CF94041|nr:zinc finger protein ZAT4-like [Mangifera indica]
MAQPQEIQDHQGEKVEMGLKQEEVAAVGDDLSLMLNILKPENMEEDKKGYDFDSVILSKDFLRTCSECGKQFTSGKALGGHKRACLQKKHQTIVRKVLAPTRFDHQRESDGGWNCFVCQQPFRSLKSLYGHMRKHPEREWRGIQPPQPASNNDVDNENVHRDDDEPCDGADAGSTMDVVESLKTWSVKAKRGHRLSSEPRLSTSVSEEDEDEDDEEAEAMQQAVNDLLLLAEYRSNKQLGSGYGVLKIKDDGVNEKAEILNTVLEAEIGKMNKRCDSEETWIENDNEEDSEMELSRKTKQLKKRRLIEFDDMDCLNEEAITVMAPQTYSCPICDKVFGKHQALGGHVASHNKIKNNFTAKESSTSLAVSASADGNCNNNGVANEQQTSGGGDNEHQCNICSKIFPTGQALGGHKRRHWTGPPEALSSSSQVTTSAGEVNQTTRNKLVLDFDLNDTPPEYFQIYGAETAAA